MHVGSSLLARARGTGAHSIAVVGTSKNAGKTVTVGALCAALEREHVPFGLCSIGRDGESIDAVDSTPKPRLFLRTGTIVASAAALLPAHPACEIIEVTGERGALGSIVIVRVRAPGFFEIAGPPSAAALRRIAEVLGARTDFVVIDGAVDRVAALRGGSDAVVVAVGAVAHTQAHAVEDVRALVARLRLPVLQPEREALFIDGALTASIASDLARAAERRQVVVGDPTQIAFGGRTFTSLAARLDLRCERSLNPIACTVASRGPERAFEPRSFLQAVAEATGLPSYDVYAGAEAA